MNDSQNDKVAIITGGGGAIALATSHALCQEGYRLALWDNNEDMLTRNTEALMSEGADVFSRVTDLTDDEDVSAAAKTVFEHFGRIDGLVNNAGIFTLTPIKELDMKLWDLILGINLRAAVLCIRETLPYLQAQKIGSIINISSISGVVARKDNLAYSASKAGLIRVTRDLAMDLAGDGIRVNAITPGSTDTPMIRNYDDPDSMRRSMLEGNLSQYRIGIPLGKLGVPEDHAHAIAFLMSDAAGHITGQNLVIDGGQTLA